MDLHPHQKLDSTSTSYVVHSCQKVDGENGTHVLCMLLSVATGNGAVSRRSIRQNQKCAVVVHFI